MKPVPRTKHRVSELAALVSSSSPMATLKQPVGRRLQRRSTPADFPLSPGLSQALLSRGQALMLRQVHEGRIDQRCLLPLATSHQQLSAQSEQVNPNRMLQVFGETACLDKEEEERLSESIDLPSPVAPQGRATLVTNLSRKFQNEELVAMVAAEVK